MSATRPETLPRGTRVGDCLIHRLAGRGSQAEVYLAWDSRQQCPVALKLFPTPAATPQRGEVEPIETGLQTLRHPNIVAVHATGHHQRRAWVTMEWVPGFDLSHYLEPRWHLPASWALATLEALALALAHAHRQGVTHRDLKPANVRIHLPTGLTKLTDFGIAAFHDHSQTATGVIKGTPAYMAPECLAGETCRVQGDLYALGVLGFELLTQRRPHQATYMGALLHDIAQKDAPPLRSLRPELPQALDRIFASLLARKPESRPSDAQAVADSLREAALELPASATQTPQCAALHDGNKSRQALPEAQ